MAYYGAECANQDAKPGEVMRMAMRAIPARTHGVAYNFYIRFEEIARKKKIELRERALGDAADRADFIL